jgi:4-alpha-glucanotransferase
MIDPVRWGVESGYWDVAGRWHDAPDDTVTAILDAMGASDRDPPPPTLETVRLDHPMPSAPRGRLVLEEGGEVTVAGPLPADLPAGYHVMHPDGRPAYGLVVSPGRVPLPRAEIWGFSAQLYATRSASSWGIGDLADLRRLGTWSAGLGAQVALINPLHAVTPTTPQQPSPYFPGSRCFVNPIYIAVGEVPGAEHVELDDLGAQARALNAEPMIDRNRVWELKSAALESIFSRTGELPDLDKFRAARGEPLERFATFCALAEWHGPKWHSWPGELRRPDSEQVRRFVRSRSGSGRVRYYAWLQMLADLQAQAAAGPLGVVHDLAIGVARDGADAWIWQETFADGITVGAPPDDFNTQGQNWDLPPFDPWRLRRAGYAPWIEALRSGFRCSAGLRVDHVMGLYRLFWIPQGSPPRRGAYVNYPRHDMLNILALEAHRAGGLVVGEDLGTVTDEARRDLTERQILSYRVWWFEDDSPRSWPRNALGAVSTHDLPTVAGVLTGSDIEHQRRLGLQPNEEGSAALQRKLFERTGAGPDTPAEQVIERVYEDLGHAPCLVLTASLDDVAAVEQRPNMPGTIDEWPNWCIALPRPLEQLEQSSLAAAVAERLNRSQSPPLPPGRA